VALFPPSFLPSRTGLIRHITLPSGNGREKSMPTPDDFPPGHKAFFLVRPRLRTIGLGVHVRCRVIYNTKVPLRVKC